MLKLSQIGHQHGTFAKIEVERSITFYTSVFQTKSKKSWPQVRETALIFANQIKQRWSSYYQEMQGLAAGAGVDVLDIVALNVRTEIAFGEFSDGCTAMAWHTEKRAFLGQNWDVS
jgi:isopenicillin-N N-acyltransferase-like protein